MGEKDNKKIVLSDKLQKDMLEFFLKTSIPRKKKQMEEQKKLSEKTSDRSNKNGG